jgi:hypothetical protein
MRLTLSLLVALVLPLLVACQATPVGTMRADAMAPAPAAAALPCSRPAAAVAVAGADVPAYAYGIGPDDHARAALSVPPQIAICLINGIQCALNALIPTVQPSLHPVTLAPAPAVRAAAAPCAPAAPAMIVVPNPVGAPARACPPPPPAPVAVAAPLNVCVGDECGVTVAAK